MLSRLFIILSLFFIFQVTETKVYTVPDDHEFCTDSYLSLYAIPVSKFTPTNNGGNFAEDYLYKAFERFTETSWLTGKENSDDFTNIVTIEFSQTVKLSKLLYQAQRYWGGKGYPIVLTLNFANETDDYNKTLTFESEGTWDRVIFDFEEIVICKKLQFVFTKVNPNYGGAASIRELIFYQDDENLKIFNNLFADYNHFQVSSAIKSIEELNKIREGFKLLINYEEKLKPELDRAEKALKGELKFDPRRQFTTNQTEEGVFLPQHGDLKGYASGTLKMVWYGINKRITGITGKTGEKFTIYVTGEPGDKLPIFVASQYYGWYGNWQRKFWLKLGVNEITIPSFSEDQLTNPKVNGGGPVYIENPYLSSEQSSNVKVYIEGGEHFPIFRKGDNEENYFKELKEYIDNFDYDRQFNITELQGVRILNTIKATIAANSYLIDNPKSPEENLNNWDEWLEKLIEFDGVSMNENDEHYDEKNKYIGTNIRLSQPYGSAFAYDEMIGIFDDGWESACAYGKAFGWGFAHEVGHLMDINDRLVTECSNNMISKFGEVVLEKEAKRGEFEKTTKSMSSDRTLAESFWSTDKFNFIVWWLIESYSIGYWGKLDNMYRYDRDDVNGMERVERQIYYSSKVVGIDVSYYFDRLGYSLDDKIFKIATASEKFKEMMKALKDSGKIRDDIQPKFWYFDEKEYTMRANGTKLNIYNGNEKFEITSIERIPETKDNKVVYQYSLILPKVDDIGHLGFEIFEGNEEKGYQVVGFTNGQQVLDQSNYEEGYYPTYKIRAVDRDLQSSAFSNPVQYSSSYACRIDNNYFYSIKEAILSVPKTTDPHTIVLLRDIVETNIIIDRSVTLVADEKLDKVYIKKGNAGNIFTMYTSYTLRIEDPKIIIDGSSFWQNDCLIFLYADSYVILRNIVLQNSFNNYYGGAMINDYASIDVKNVTFINNSAGISGGAISCRKNSGSLTVDNCTFINNYAKEGGGAIHTNIWTNTISNSIFRDNYAANGGAIYSYDSAGIQISNIYAENNKATNGGALYFDSNGKIKDSTIKGNNAVNGGGLYFSSSNKDFEIEISNTTFTENKAENGGGLYINGKTKITASTISKNRAMIGGGIYYTTSIKKDMSILSTTFNGNTATKTGGFIYVDTTDSNLVIDNCQFNQVSSLRRLSDSKDKTGLYVEKGEVEIEGKIPPIETGNGLEITEGKDTTLKTSTGTITLKGVTKQSLIVEDTITVDLIDINLVDKTFLLNTNSLLIPKSLVPYNQGDKTKYVAWKNDEKEYFDDEEISVVAPITLYMTIKNKYKVSLKVQDEPEKLYYLRPNEKFTFPRYESETFTGWEVGGKIYKAEEVLIVTQDVEGIAKFGEKKNSSHFIAIIIAVCFVVLIASVGIIIHFVMKKRKVKLAEEVLNVNEV